MVQISKLTKNEINQTGFNNRSIAAKFMKTVLNKKARDFKKKEELINTLKKEYTKMKNFGIDLNENAQAEKKLKKIEKTIKTGYKQKEEFENYLIKNMDDEAVLEMSIAEYLKGIGYEIPKNIDYKHAYKSRNELIQDLIIGKLKSKYYYKWQGIEEVQQTITYLYRKQQTAFKFNISMSYLLRRPIWTIPDVRGNREQIGWEYKYYSGQYNNRLFEYPQTIDNNKTLNAVLTQTEKLIINNTQFHDRPDTEWKFVRFLDYEITIFKLQTTIGYAVSLPLHFGEDSNKKKVIKFENFTDNLCFWRCLAAHTHPEQKDYRRLETPTKVLYSNFYGKKYDILAAGLLASPLEDASASSARETSYEGVKYLEYRKFRDADVYEEEFEKAIDEIDKIEHHFKININIYTQDQKEETQIDRRSVNNYDDVLYLLRHDNHFCYIKKIENFASRFK